MKKILFLLCLIGGAVSNANAQWTTSGTNAYFNLTGNVGVGTSTPSYKLEIAGVVSAINNGQAGFHIYNGGGNSEWFLQQKSQTDHNFYITKFVSGASSDFFTINAAGNVGISTPTPSSYFHGGTNKVLEIFNPNTTLNSQSHVILSTGSTLDGSSGGTLSWVSKNSTGNQGMAYIASQIQGSASTNAAANLVFGVSSGSGIVSKMVLDKNGNLGIGTSAPATKLHVVGIGSSIDGGNSFSYNGDGLAIQANSGSRSATTGAQLEFVIPANTDGSNLWGQGRILTVAGNTNSGDATGKMIIGTRRNFNKLGTGAQWYYGNDIVIDGAGNVGIGTLTPREALSVNGTIRSKEVKVELTNWPDYVFMPNYKLPSLAEVKNYIDKNQRLPGIPSAKEVETDGLSLGEMNKLLMKKVEELTLYLIEKDKRDKERDELILDLKKQLAELKNH